MHARHRSPGNGYNRSGSGTGMVLGSSRISPETSIRNHGGFYSSSPSDYRNFNRGGGGGGGFGRNPHAAHSHPKSFQQQPPPPPPPPPPAPPLPRKPDIFMEAGRLAAEYLVSQGLLPSTVLSSKWQNGSFKKQQQQQVGELWQQDTENLQLPQEGGGGGRTSALARLGNAVSDTGSGRRRFVFDDFNSVGFRNHAKGGGGGRRRAGNNNYRGYGSDWGQREYSRSGSFPDRPSRVSPDTEFVVDDDGENFSGQRDELQVSKDVGNNGLQKFGLNDLASKSEDAADSEYKLEKYQFLDDRSGSRPSSSGWEDSSNRTGEETGAIETEDVRGNGKVEDSSGIDKTEKQNEELSIQQHKAVESDPSGNTSTDLLTLCKFAKVPTRTRSSLTSKSPKVDPPPTAELENDSEEATIVAHGGSSGDVLMEETHDSGHLDPKIIKAQADRAAENVKELDTAYTMEQNGCLRSLSFSDRAFMCHSDQEPSQGQIGFGSCGPMVKERGEKRVLEEKDMQEATKKSRVLLPSTVIEADESFRLSNLNEKELSLREGGAMSNEKAMMDVYHDGGVANDSSYPKEASEHCVKYAQEKQLFPGSFKICDLNLMEVSDTHDNHDGDPIIIYPTLSEIKREAAPLDIDLSISNSNAAGENSRCPLPVDGKEIEVIDLENDSAPEDKNLSIAERKTETVYGGLEGFSNHTQNTGDIPDVQDGYGLMMELLGNDFPNCSSVPEDINSMHNGISLHNGEATLADDDSIYMSLGEIPLTFLRPWEQPPPQEYGKPF
ncbi:uncharacterized protein At4g26450 isoform X1 [Ziziphus jujuba]|uniref:Uncharacterized protein At4g26450 isoform X1 n=1 Tax=Ziziphus jujuba TaxID=326968 RepID=A0A6P4A0V6_ZIZJJ|nr:uncharacterized protein At4g26450 isoform X1 [Ziziphus jujuba]